MLADVFETAEVVLTRPISVPTIGLFDPRLSGAAFALAPALAAGL